MAATALLLDLDGTIWDSYPCYGAALHGALGLTQGSTIELLREGGNAVALSRACGLSDSRFSRLCREAVAEVRLYPDVRATLGRLRKRGTTMGVVTNLPKWLIGPILRDLELIQYFDTLIYSAGKPRPTGINKALAALGLEAKETISYVGDMASDAGAAARAGVSFAWASYGYAAERPEGSDVVLNSFSDVLSL